MHPPIEGKGQLSRNQIKSGVRWINYSFIFLFEYFSAVFCDVVLNAGGSYFHRNWNVDHLMIILYYNMANIIIVILLSKTHAPLFLVFQFSYISPMHRHICEFFW